MNTKVLLAACSCIMSTLAVGTLYAADSAPTLVPAPKQVKWTGDSIKLLQGSTIIVIGDSASEPEQYAAEMLQKMVLERFDQNWPIVKESNGLGNYSNAVVMGQRSTCRMIDNLSRRWKLDFSPKALAADGYIIHFGSDAGRNIAMVGGSNPRSVAYGQDTLFQLVRKGKDDTEMVRASIKDWPSIAWRGRPHIVNITYLTPGRLDAFIRGRINWIDLRDGAPGTNRSGQYGYEPGCPLKVDEIKEVVKQAHRRGLFIYATVNCAVRPNQYDAVIKTYEELLALGADGLYISIDDPGAEFRLGTSSELIMRVLELGRKHKMTGPKIAIVPGKESYVKVITDVNKRVAKIPGMEEALWYWTVVPCEEALEEARSIGLKTKPGWWHNWPRPDGGFTSNPGGTGRLKKGLPYREPMAMADGWGKPSYEKLVKAGEYTDAVMPWGGTAWGADYNAGAFGWWAWAPELHNWKAARTRIYSIVYGPDQVEAAFDFDDSLIELRSMFVVPGDGMNSSAPAYLKNVSDRQKALETIEHMKQAFAKIRSGAPAQTLIDSKILANYYFEPMQTLLDVAKTLSNVNFPEYWWTSHETRALRAVRSGHVEQAVAWDTQAKQRMELEVDQVHNTLADVLQGLDDYVKWWHGRYTTVTAIPRITQAPRITGDISDAAWQQAYATQEFKLSWGADPTDNTEMRMMYTDTDLYLGFTCYETDMNSLVVNHRQRDSDVYMDDSVEIFLNPDCIGETVYQLISNAEGYQADGRKIPGATSQVTWSADWEVKTVRVKDRWTAEVRIPFKSLGIDNSPAGQIWMCNFARNDRGGAGKGMETNNPGESCSWNGSGNFHDSSAYRSVYFKK